MLLRKPIVRRIDIMSDPISSGLSLVQIIQNAAAAKRDKKFQKDVMLRLDRIENLVMGKLGPNPSTEEVIAATADTVANLSISTLFLDSKDDTIVLPGPAGTITAPEAPMTEIDEDDQDNK